jgi:hypothetical protein
MRDLNLSNDIETFSDKSSVRTSFWMKTFFVLLFVGLMVFGGWILKVIGSFGLFLTALNLFLDHGSVTLNDTGVLLRTIVWGRINFSEIASVERYQRPPLDGIWRLLSTQAQRQAFDSMMNPAVAIYLRSSKWFWQIYPFPFPRKLSFVQVYLSQEDEERFLMIAKSKVQTET